MHVQVCFHSSWLGRLLHTSKRLFVFWVVLQLYRLSHYYERHTPMSVCCLSPTLSASCVCMPCYYRMPAFHRNKNGCFNSSIPPQLLTTSCYVISLYTLRFHMRSVFKHFLGLFESWVLAALTASSLRRWQNSLSATTFPQVSLMMCIVPLKSWQEKLFALLMSC